MGTGVQTITATLAAALKLSRESGVVISDISPGSPAQSAGLNLNDIVLAVDGRSIDNLPMYMMGLLVHERGQPVQLLILRGRETMSFAVPAVDESHASDHLADLVDPEKGQIPKLGILGVGIDKQTEVMFPNLRGPYGVAVAGRMDSPNGAAITLQMGDVIHEVNGAAVSSVESLRTAIGKMEAGDPVALLVERDGMLLYVAFEME